MSAGRSLLRVSAKFLTGFFLVVVMLPTVVLPAFAADSPGSISGTVYGPDGTTPLEGIWVMLSGSDFRFTGADGSYSFTGLRAGEYRILFDSRMYNEWNKTYYLCEYYDGADTRWLSTPVIVEYGVNTPNIDAKLSDARGSISGTVYGPDGTTPLAGVNVIADGIDWGEATTAADGSYAINLLPAGDYVVSFDPSDYNSLHAPGCAFEYYGGVTWAEAATLVTVSDKKNTPGIDARLKAAGSISGTVYGPDGTTPIEGVSVFAYGDDFGSASTTVDGSYTVTGLAAGEYVVLFDTEEHNATYNPDYAWEYYDGTTSDEAATLVDVKTGVDATGIDATLERLVFTATSIEGANRYATSVSASKEAFPLGSDYVVIATGTDFPDALGGAALAGVLDAPLLLTGKDVLPTEVRAEIVRLGATDAIVLGGTGAVSKAVFGQIDAIKGVSVERIAGANRFGTAEVVATRVIAGLGEDYDGTAFVATGMNFPDALGASPLAAANGWPIYLDSPEVGSDAKLIATMKAARVERVIILGGGSVVPSALEDSLKRAFGTGAVERLAGDNRYATAAKVAAYGVTKGGLSYNGVAIATGQDFPDALAGGVLQGLDNSVMLLTPSVSLHGVARDTLVRNAADIYEVRFLGGTGAVSSVVRGDVKVILKK